MESIKTLALIFIFLFVTENLWAKKSSPEKVVKVIGIFYLDIPFGHLHQNPSRFSLSLTNLSCGHPVKAVDQTSKDEDKGWFKVQVGGKEGFIEKKFLSSSRPECFQKRYSKFFDSFNFDLSELYYWGRMFDQFDSGQSKPQ